MQNIVRRYLDIWNVRDAGARKKAIAEVFDRTCRYVDPMASVSGIDGVDAFIAGVQTQFQGVRFELAGNVDAHHDVARFTWHATLEGVKEPLAIGFDVITVVDERIRLVTGFLDKAPG